MSDKDFSITLDINSGFQNISMFNSFEIKYFSLTEIGIELADSGAFPLYVEADNTGHRRATIVDGTDIPTVFQMAEVSRHLHFFVLTRSKIDLRGS